ncbi:MAG: amidohydrolase family protein [Oscillospiraceae bacterium]
MSILLRNACYISPDCGAWHTGDILIDGGVIKEIGFIDAGKEQPEEIIDCTNKIVIPGLINSHTHSYTGYLKGTIDNVPLDIYMLFAIAGGSFRTPREIFISSQLEALNMLKRGTTSIVDHFAERPAISLEGLKSTAEGFKALGMKAKVATMFADRGFFETVPMLPGELPREVLAPSGGKQQTVDEYIEEVEKAYCEYRDDELIDIMLGTDGPQRCSDELLLKTGELEAKYKMGWETHILEAKTQALVANRAYGKGLIEHMDELGILNERTALVHHVWVSDKELELVAKRGATVVHCPSSNLHLGSGVAPIDRYVDMGIDVAIGTDGGNCGSVGILEQVKLVASLHNVAQVDYEKWFSAEAALRMEYAGGAKILGKKIGKLEVGYEADLTLIDIDNVFWQPVNNLSRQLVYYENGSNVDTVFIAGRKVLEHGKSTLINEADLLAEAKEIADKLKKDSAKSFELVEKQIPYFRGMYMREIKNDVGYNRFIRDI